MMKMRRGDVMKIERARDRDLGDLGRLLPVTRDRHHRPTDELEDIFRKSRSRSRRSREIVTRYSEIVITDRRTSRQIALPPALRRGIVPHCS